MNEIIVCAICAGLIMTRVLKNWALNIDPSETQMYKRQHDCCFFIHRGLRLMFNEISKRDAALDIYLPEVNDNTDKSGLRRQVWSYPFRGVDNCGKCT